MRRHELLADHFDEHRTHLRSIAYRMLGSVDEADDAVQQTWLRVRHIDAGPIANVRGWLTTVVSRVCLDVLRARRRRGELPLTTEVASEPTRGLHDGGPEPEDEVVLVESVGRALLVVLDRLSPAERVAFVLHDLFAVPFSEIGPIVDRTPVAAKKLASRARARVHGGEPPARPPSRHAREQRAIVEAFLHASRSGDLDTLLELLAPDVVRRADRFAVPSDVPTEVRGARAVAEETRVFAARARLADVALVGGRPGIVVAPHGRLLAVLDLTITDGRITTIDVVADPSRVGRIALACVGRSPLRSTGEVRAFPNLHRQG